MFDSDTDLDSEELEMLPIINAVARDLEKFQNHSLVATIGKIVLTVIANVILAAITFLIAPVVYYSGCLITRGTEFREWPEYDPITWFLSKVNAEKAEKVEAEVSDFTGYNSPIEIL